jgi:hypothetical protein
MALHLKIEALKKIGVMYVVLESPTGTGKSAAIVCSVLAWQRHYRTMNQTSGAVTTAIYVLFSYSLASGTNQKWYRPYAKFPIDHARMAVSGSRERLCI